MKTVKEIPESSPLKRILICMILALASALAVSGCATTSSPQGNSTGSVENDPLYDGVATITFDSLLTGDDTGDFERLGDRALRMGQQDKAVYAYLRALQQGGDKAVLFTNIGEIHKARGNSKLAQLAFNRALEAEPDHVPALLGAGLILLSQRHYDLAESKLEQAVALDKRRVEKGNTQVATAYPEGEMRGVTVDREKLPGESARDLSEDGGFKSYDVSSPVGAYNGLGMLADLAGEFDRAIAFYRVADAIRPGSAVTQNNLGYSYYLAGDLAAAEEHFRRTIHLDPEFERGWRNLALVLSHRQQYEEAVRALSHVGDKSEAYNILGYLCMMQGMHDDARRFLEKAISLSPVYYEMAYQNLERNRLMKKNRLSN